MEREVQALMQAVRAELDGCHGFLDETGCPRVVNGKSMTLRQRIQALVLADHMYGGMMDQALGEIRSIKALLDDLAEFGQSMPQETLLPPLAQRVYDALTDLQVKFQARVRLRTKKR